MIACNYYIIVFMYVLEIIKISHFGAIKHVVPGSVTLVASPVNLIFPQASDENLQDLIPLFDATKKNKAKICAVEALKEPTEESIDECAVPLCVESLCNYDVPPCAVPILSSLLEQYKCLFRKSPGSTTLAEHFIPITGTPVKVPPRRIPANYRQDVER